MSLQHVFISYARVDQDFVLRLAALLKERSVPIWLDQGNIEAGADWDRSIENGLRNCNKFLIVLSPAAVDSNQVRGELQTAVDDNKTIVPVIYQSCTVPRMLRLIQHIDMTGGKLDDQTIDKLVAALLRHPEQATSSAAYPTAKSRRKPTPILIGGGITAVLILIGSGVWYSVNTPSGPSLPPPSPPAIQPGPSPSGSGLSPAGNYPQFSERQANAAELVGLDCEKLWIARNEIYARHGYHFQTPRAREYFSRQPWYHPSPNENQIIINGLNNTEKANIAKIREYEGRQSCSMG